MLSISYEFLGLLPVTETLAVRGHRLQETAAQRQGKVYAPDVFLSVEVETGERRLEVGFDNYLPLIAAHGERVHLSVQLVNIGTKDIGEVWLVHGPSDILWLSDKSELASGKICVYSNRSPKLKLGKNQIFPLQGTHPKRSSLEIQYLHPIL